MSSSAPAAVAPADPDAGTLVEVSRELARIDREGGWNRTFSIGRLILDTFFGGEASCWLSRHRPGRQSLRRLAARPECPLKKSALAEAVSVYLIALQLPEVTRSRVITPSHVACVLKLEEAARKKLLREADEQEISVRELRERVAAIRAISRRAAPKSATRSTKKRLQDRLYTALEALRDVRLTLTGGEGGAPLELVYSLWRLVESLETEVSETRDTLRALFRTDACAAE